MLPGHDTVHTEFESDAAVVLLKLAQEFQPSSSPIKLGVLISTLHSSAAEILSRKGGGASNNKAQREREDEECPREAGLPKQGQQVKPVGRKHTDESQLMKMKNQQKNK